MNIKILLVVCLLGGLLTACNTQKAPVQWSEQMAQSEMKRFPEPWMIEKAKKPRWGYTHGLVVKAMLEEWKHTGDTAYYEYARVYADSLIDPEGRIKTYKFSSFNIDNVNAGKILFDLYACEKDARYKIAMDTLCRQMQVHPRTSEGGFWHKKIYPHQMWLDGIFMASPYLAQYGQEFQDTAWFADVVNQILLIADHTYDPETGLYYHGWDESREQRWADPEKGTSPCFWSRSIGWYAAALVDVLDYLPEHTPRRDSVIGVVRSLAPALVRWQDSLSGTWWQVTDQGNREGNYLESSASSLFVYFLFKAVRKGYIGEEYLVAANKGFDGLVKTFIRPEEDGTISITHCCAVSGLGGTKKYRDGSFEYYISEPVIDNDPKSTGSFILAAIEHERQNAKGNL